MQPIDFTFYKEHTNRDSNSTLIMMMSDDHLRSTIAVFLRKLESFTLASQNAFASLDPISQTILADKYKRAVQLQKDQIPFILATLNAYMSEAVFVRNMVDFIPHYQKAVGRDKIMFDMSSLTMIEGSDDDSYDGIENDL